MKLDDIKAETARLAGWAYLATIGTDGKPHVVPVHPGWEGGTLWISTGTKSVKARNIQANPDVALHWQANESGDSVMMSAKARVYTDIETKRRLWTGVFSYDLNDFVPDGPESEEAAFVQFDLERAVAFKQFGMAGRDVWQREGGFG